MLLSIIIPMYNAASTIKTCLDSIGVNPDMEVILVDDGSTDDTRAVCEAYIQGKSGYVLLTQENGGPQSAINHALSCVSGSYVGFVDSDDTVSEDFFSTLAPRMESGAHDIIAFSYLRVARDGTACENRISAHGVYTGDALYTFKKHYLTDGGMQFSSLTDPGRWNKVYRTSLIVGKRAQFDEAYRLGEDILMTTICVLASENILALDDAFLYHYIDTPNSLSKDLFENYWVKYGGIIERLKTLYLEAGVTDAALDGMYVYFGKAILKRIAQTAPRRDFRHRADLILRDPHFIAGLATVNTKRLSGKDKVYFYLVKHRLYLLIRFLLRKRA